MISCLFVQQKSCNGKRTDIMMLPTNTLPDQRNSPPKVLMYPCWKLWDHTPTWIFFKRLFHDLTHLPLLHRNNSMSGRRPHTSWHVRARSRRGILSRAPRPNGAWNAWPKRQTCWSEGGCGVAVMWPCGGCSMGFWEISGIFGEL